MVLVVGLLPCLLCGVSGGTVTMSVTDWVRLCMEELKWEDFFLYIKFSFKIPTFLSYVLALC